MSTDNAAAAELAGGEAEKAGEGAEGELVIDWSKLSVLFAERLDLMYELSEAGRDREPTKEERRLMAEVESAMREVLSRARSLSDDPFYDPRVLLGMCEAMCTPALGLSEKQEEHVRAALAELFAARVEGFDPDAALPTEGYRVRQSFLSGLDEAVAGALDEAQAARWEKINALARHILEGDSTRVAMPMAPEGGGGPEAREAGVVEEWQRAFSLAEGQSALAQPLAAEFISRADSVLARYGQLEAAPRQLSAAEQARMQAEVLEQQIEAETQLLQHLSPEQREALRGRAPTVLQFAPGGQAWTDVRRGSQL
jgi:hypothetical protein